MKALILKDYYVLKRQFLFFAAICLIFYLTPRMNFIAALYAALLPASAFAYDDRSRWGELAAMLPYSDSQIVLSRYILGWLSALIFSVVGTAGMFFLRTADFLHQIESQPANPTSFVIAFCLSASFLALSLPLYFRFDAEKSRVIRMFLIALVCGVIGGLYGLLGIASVGGPGTDADFLINPLFALLTAVILNAVSIPLSILAYRARRK